MKKTSGTDATESFSSLIEWASRLPFVQLDDTSKPSGDYKAIEVFSCQFCRKDDARIAEAIACRDMQNQISRKIQEPVVWESNWREWVEVNETRLHWREKLEHTFVHAPLITKFDVNGPDCDIISDRKCHMDHDWWAYKVYARFGLTYVERTPVAKLKKKPSIMAITRGMCGG